MSFLKSDKRNTYIQLTDKGEAILLDLMEHYEPSNNSVFSGALPLRDLYGKFPEFMELMTVIRKIYGEDFMDIFERSFHHIEEEFTEEDGKLVKKDKENHQETISNS